MYYQEHFSCYSGTLPSGYYHYSKKNVLDNTSFYSECSLTYSTTDKIICACPMDMSVILQLQECNDPCCNARTCQMADGAQCTRGECCSNTCQFVSAGTTCRSSDGQCDIAEHCTGQSSECPTDVHAQDGSSCNNNQAYCFSGECRTYNAQCQEHFGTST